MDKVLLHQGDEGKQVVGKSVGPANAVERAKCGRIEVRQDLAHHDPLLNPVDQQPLAIGRVVAQDSGAEAVERGDPRLAVVVLQTFVDPARDLPGRARGESEDQDLIASGHARAHRLLVQVDERVRFARARSGQHAEGSGYLI